MITGYTVLFSTLLVHTKRKAGGGMWMEMAAVAAKVKESRGDGK